MKKRALIWGITGMDGSYLAELLHSRGYEVGGVYNSTSPSEKIKWLDSLVPKIILFNSTLTPLDILRVFKPSEIYNFAGISNVFAPYDNMDQLYVVNAFLPQRILSAINETDRNIRFFQASSCLIFGNNKDGVQNEQTCPSPKYPYGAAKLYAQNIVKMYRDDHDIFACSAIFYPHESERRGNDFFTKKVVRGVARIKMGEQDTLNLGSLDHYRDYGYAPDYVDAAYRMMQYHLPMDFIVGTGSPITLGGFVQKCFDYVGLRGHKYITTNKTLDRKNECEILTANAEKIRNHLGWEPTTSMDQMIKKMMDHEIAIIENEQKDKRPAKVDKTKHRTRTS